MRQRTIVLVITAAAVILVLGCARTTTRGESAATVPAASSSAAATDLSGAWRGSSWAVGGSLLWMRSAIALQINDDQTWAR